MSMVRKVDKENAATTPLSKERIEIREWRIEKYGDNENNKI